MMNETSHIKVLLVDDHGIVLEGLRRILDQEPDIKVVGIARNGAKLSRWPITKRPMSL